jgi:hypothetical protein
MIRILWATTLCRLVNTVVAAKDDLDCMDPNMLAAGSSKIPVNYLSSTRHHIKTPYLHPHH